MLLPDREQLAWAAVSISQKERKQAIAAMQQKTLAPGFHKTRGPGSRGGWVPAKGWY